MAIEDEARHEDPVAHYLRADGEWKAGVRPANVVETPDDLDWLLAHRNTAKIHVVCRWCGREAWVRNASETGRWWREHPCAEALVA